MAIIPTLLIILSVQFDDKLLSRFFSHPFLKYRLDSETVPKIENFNAGDTATLFSRENIRGRHYDALSIYIRLLNFLTIAVFFNYILNSFVRT